MSADLNPDFPIVSGKMLLTQGWYISLPEEFNRRIEDGSLVLWKDELTFWINVWNNDQQLPVDELMQRLIDGVSPERRDEQIQRSGATSCLTYALTEDAVDSINGYIVAAPGYVQISAYADSPAAQAQAYAVIRSIHRDAA